MVLEKSPFPIKIKKKEYIYIIQKKRSVKFRSGLIFAIIVALTGFSCKNKGDKNISQGEIHYAIEYIGNVGMMPKELMPRLYRL